MQDVDHRGIVLTEQVDIDWLRNLNPQRFMKFIKFTIDPNSEKVCVGMEAHRNGGSVLGNGTSDYVNTLYGGNLFYDTNIVEWESGLNVRHNIKIGLEANQNPRFLTDKDTIERLERILRIWVNY